MIADIQLMEKIEDLIQQLSPEKRLRLIQRITETLIPSVTSQEAKPLEFGKYKGNRMSTLEDFKVAEWQPTDREFNGG